AIRAGLAVADAVDALLGGPVARLKWPNDVLLDDRKIAGVLCEGRWQGDRLQWLAVGVGVNVRNALPAAVASRAVALHERLPDVRRTAVLDRLGPPPRRRAPPQPARSRRLVPDVASGFALGAACAAALIWDGNDARLAQLWRDDRAAAVALLAGVAAWGAAIAATRQRALWRWYAAAAVAALLPEA